MRFALAILFATVALAQSPGTVVVGAASFPITAIAGTATCVLTVTPAVLASNCNTQPASSSETWTIPLPVPAPGYIGTFTAGVNVISWQVTPWATPGTQAGAVCPIGSTAGTCWMVVANGTSKLGVF